ncbi:MAG: GerMN domain-containing protein [Acidobacteriota bacterium]
MNKKIIYTLISLAVIFFVTSLIIYLSSSGTFKRAIEDKKGDSEVVEETSPELEKVKIFFLTNKSYFFLPKNYELEKEENRLDFLKNFLDLMIRETSNFIAPFPEQTRLQSIFYIDDKQMAVLDFNEELLINFAGGSRGEIEFIYFFVNNLCYNFKEIKKVKILVAGNEYKTLSGHLDIENPYFPNYKYFRQ